MSIVKKTLGELCIIEKGKIGIQKAIPGEFPLVVTAEERLSHNEYHFEGNSVVIPLVSSTGHGHKSLKRIHFQSGKFAVGNILCAVMPKDETVLNAEYLYRFLDLNREKELVGRMKGMANVSLPLKEIALIEIPLPPVAEQLKFVEEYKQLETAKNNLDVELTHQLTLVKQLRQSFLREAMQGKLTADFRSAHTELIEGENSAQALLEKIKAEKKQLIKDGKLKKEKELAPVGEDEIPFEIPEGWVWCRLGEIVEIQMGQSPDGSSYNKTENGMPFYQGKSEFGYKYPKGVSIWCTEPKKIAKNKDILISVRAPVGDVNIADNYYAIGRGLSILRIINDAIDHFFLFYYLDSIKRNWKAIGSFFEAINRDIIENKLFPLPPLSEQQAIVSKLDDLMRTCDELEASIRSSQQQNEMLLREVLREALEG